MKLPGKRSLDSTELVNELRGTLATGSRKLAGRQERRTERGNAAEVIRLQDGEEREINEYEKKWGKAPLTLSSRPRRTKSTSPTLKWMEVLVMTREEKSDSSGKLKEGSGGLERKFSVKGREVKSAILYEGQHADARAGGGAEWNYYTAEEHVS